jgi:hypothetical protein
MKQNHIPNHVQAKLDTFERAVTHLTQQVSRTQEAIAGARQRLTGGFQRDSEYKDLRASLDRLVADKPILENKLHSAENTLADCKAFLAALPDDAVLEPVAPVKPNGCDLHTVRQRIRDAEDELKALRAVPEPSADIKERIQDYVGSLARPRVSGIARGVTLRVSWPDDKISVLALLLGDRMVEVLSQEVERMANDPMPLPKRQQRIGELEAEIDSLQRQALALGADTHGLPPAVVLGVRVASRSSRAA